MQPTIISTLFTNELRPDCEAAATISQVQHLASYNWIESDHPTIAIPGSPNLWRLLYIAQNAARHPASPMEPLFRSLYFTRPAFDIGAVDIVTDRNNIRKLLTFINPRHNRSRLEDFTIQIERQGRTMLLCRQEIWTRDFIPRQQFRGFGHEFENAATSRRIPDSTGHYRIVSYDFAGLSCLVRYETDGYALPDDGGDSAMGRSSPSILDPPRAISAYSALRICEGGQTVPTQSILEIKTKARREPVDLQQVLPQMWVSQTSQLACAYYEQDGWFIPCWPEDVESEIREWEENHQTDLQRLAALLRWIFASVPTSGQKATLQYYSQRKKLVISHAERAAMLPPDLYNRW
ncbi:geranylgeranyl pyrophosphate synthetase [Aspergillus brunneoviolaceus CBS 621.78]|uniref:Geranylgeranyl pyrophosphate synthetase n=1 Tax=Aspergillus brunneoviolaceus CBS 621.78 TaxID=1450534 RepID=A0ACD1FSR8_9EURO|nr:geranylgeranyl pyrophosphate synthetase [Aspergillus brunneoviolaceus CBS 621.78]RAH40030.1 geranylgeranyl pyrophosphate synthetase [Aspergillus brunneoviolaceus CBS 621.78]